MKQVSSIDKNRRLQCSINSPKEFPDLCLGYSIKSPKGFPDLCLGWSVAHRTQIDEQQQERQ